MNLSTIDPYEVHCRICGCPLGILAADPVVDLLDSERDVVVFHETACVLKTQAERDFYVVEVRKNIHPHHRRWFVSGDPKWEGRLRDENT